MNKQELEEANKVAKQIEWLTEHRDRLKSKLSFPKNGEELATVYFWIDDTMQLEPHLSPIKQDEFLKQYQQNLDAHINELQKKFDNL